MASVLAAIDQPWSRRELRTVLEENDQADSDDLLSVAAAMHCCDDRDAKEFAEAWMAKCDQGQIDITMTMAKFNILCYSDLAKAVRRNNPESGEPD